MLTYSNNVGICRYPGIVKRYAFSVKRLSLRNYQRIDDIQPSQNTVDNGPQNGFIPAPGDDNCDDCAQTDPGPDIHGLHISIIRSVAGGQK